MFLMTDTIQDNLRSFGKELKKYHGNEKEQMSNDKINQIEEPTSLKKEKGYDSETATHTEHLDHRRTMELKTKMIQLNKVKEAEDSKQEESMEKDPLFMNIDKIAKLPMASKKPTKILTSQSLLDYDRNSVPNHTKASQL